MANLADLDKAYLVPCKHCAEPMHEWELFCPFCGKDQTATEAAGAKWLADPEPGPDPYAPGPAEEALAAMAVQSTAMPQQEAWVPIAHPNPTSAANEDVNAEVGLVRPGAIWQSEAPGGGGPEQAAGGNSSTRGRWLIGIGATLLVLLLLALVHDHFYVDKQAEAVRLREFKANVQQVQGALSQDDLSAAERVLDALNAEHATDPGVQKLREVFDRRVQEQVAKREALRAATPPKAPPVRGVAGAVAPTAQAPVAPEAPVAALPAPEIGMAESKEKVCNEALAALALCAMR